MPHNLLPRILSAGGHSLITASPIAGDFCQISVHDCIFASTAPEFEASPTVKEAHDG